MSEKEKTIIESFDGVLKQLSANDKERLLAFCEGMAFKASQMNGEQAGE